jgi:hypothetical protein
MCEFRKPHTRVLEQNSCSCTCFVCVLYKVLELMPHTHVARPRTDTEPLPRPLYERGVDVVVQGVHTYKVCTRWVCARARVRARERGWMWSYKGLGTHPRVLKAVQCPYVDERRAYGRAAFGWASGRGWLVWAGHPRLRVYTVCIYPPPSGGWIWSYKSRKRGGWIEGKRGGWIEGKRGGWIETRCPAV